MPQPKTTRKWTWPHAGAKKRRKNMPAKWKKQWARRKKAQSEKKRVTACSQDLSDEALCEFLVGFTEKFWPDYLQVRAALCNVERRAFGFGTGGSAAAAMCGDGPGDDPPPPPPPPTFN